MQNESRLIYCLLSYHIGEHAHRSATMTSSTLRPNANDNTRTTNVGIVKNKILPLTEFTQPNDDQAIVFNCISDYRVIDYLLIIKDLVSGPQNIVAASKVSRNRIIFHLKTSDMVKDFFKEHGGFQIGDNYIKCRQMKIPLKKIIFSHINPNIPNQLLESYIREELRLELSSHISFLRLNPHHELFGHIVCWRRQFYTSSQLDLTSLPGSFLIEHDGQSHRIFITLDEFTRYRCHQKGHRAEDCPQSARLNEEDEEFQFLDAKQQLPQNELNISCSDNKSLHQNESSSQPTRNNSTPIHESLNSDLQIQNKRTLSSTTSELSFPALPKPTTSAQLSNNPVETASSSSTPEKKKKTKKLETDQVDETDTITLSTKQILSVGKEFIKSKHQNRSMKIKFIKSCNKLAGLSDSHEASENESQVSPRNF